MCSDSGIIGVEGKKGARNKRQCGFLVRRVGCKSRTKWDSMGSNGASSRVFGTQSVVYVAFRAAKRSTTIGGVSHTRADWLMDVRIRKY
jgi:hypothetical protein